MRVGRTFGFCQNIGNTNTFKYGTHCTACNNTGTGRSRFDEYFCATKLSCLLMRYSAFQDRNTGKILFGCFHTFCNRCGHFAGLTEAPSNNTILITNNHNSRETKSSTTFSNLSNTIDSYESVLQLNVARYLYSVINCHDY